MFYNFIEFIILLYTFTNDIICLISFSEFADVLPAFTCASNIGNL